MAVDGAMARRAWRPLETIHGSIYFAPEAPEEYGAIGVEGRWPGYFGSRSAPMGAVPAEVVISTFFNFEPGRVRAAMDGLWQKAPPETLLAARLRAVDRSLRRLLGVDVVASPDVAEAAGLARQVAEGATTDVVGRPLFAGHASLPWPDGPHLVLWHAAALIREHRGDGHIAALVGEGLGGCEALVSHAGSGDVPRAALQSSRGWSDDAWDAAVGRLVARGLVEVDGSFTGAGREQRARIEAATDAAAVLPWALAGEEAMLRLGKLAAGLSKAMIAAGAFGSVG